MCEYCEDYKLDKKEIYKDDNGAYLKLNEHSTKILWIDDQTEMSAEINYCPMCGRKL